MRQADSEAEEGKINCKSVAFFIPETHVMPQRRPARCEELLLKMVERNTRAFSNKYDTKREEKRRGAWLYYRNEMATNE